MQNLKKKREGLSLNELHTRRLLSATPSTRHLPRVEDDDRPKFNLDDDDDDEVVGVRNDDVPCFSAIADLDSPPRVEDYDDRPKFNLDDDVDDEVVGVRNDDVPCFSAITDLDSPPQKSKVEKVKIEGRRRLCKVSVQSDDHQTEEENPHFFDVSDFSSPPPRKDVGCGGDEIRDILNNLSSRLEFLSIDKKKNTKPADLKPVPLDDELSKVVTDKGMKQKKNELEEAEFTSAGSSFAGSSERSSSSSGVIDVAESKVVEHTQSAESDGDNFDEVNKTQERDIKRVSTKECVVSDERPDVSYTKPVYDPKDLSDEDECVEVGSAVWKKAEEGRNGLVDQDSGDSGVVEAVDYHAKEVISGDEHAITLKGPRSTFKLSAKIGQMLYPHQRDGLKWLWSLHCQGKGGILGDDMGLGKTMQICGYLAGLFHSRLIKRVMVVAPKTLIPHWMKELGVVGISHLMKEYFGTSSKLRQYELNYVLQDKGILLTTYDIVRNNAKELCGSNIYDEDSDDAPLWDYMILDEGHLIKNPSTQRAKSLLGIPCAHRIIISGTPIQNNLKELWALFNFCCPDLLGDKQGFKERYEHPILRGNDKKASERDRRVGSMVAKELRERIQPYFLRRMKSEVFRDDGSTDSAKLSQKNEIIVWLRLTKSQRHLYEAFLKSEIVLSAFDGSPLAAITILKKICDHPYLLTKRAAEDLLEGMDSMLNQEDRGLAEKLAMHAADLTEEDDLKEKHDSVSCKISFILSLLEKLIPEGHNVLIFSQTRKMLNLIQETLVAYGFEFLRIDGTTKAIDRLKIVNEFQEGHGAPIFLLTSQVGGLGLTLTKADRVIVVDPAWNPSTDNQSVDRAYRIGQKKDVIVYRLMTCSTIEEKIYRMQVFKGGLFKTATEHKEQTRYFTQQDLKELFSLPKNGFDISPTQQQLHEEHGDQLSMSNYLKDHIKFLESLGIGGVSHHSLLYSKSDPTPDVLVEEEEIRRGATYMRHYPGSSTERPVDGSQYAFKPKEVNHHNRAVSSLHSPASMTESEIKDKIRRLSALLSNQSAMSKLPDKGAKIRKQMLELALELENMAEDEKNNEVIDLDDISDKLHSSLRV